MTGTVRCSKCDGVIVLDEWHTWVLDRSDMPVHREVSYCVIELHKQNAVLTAERRAEDRQHEAAWAVQRRNDAVLAVRQDVVALVSEVWEAANRRRPWRGTATIADEIIALFAEDAP